MASISIWQLVSATLQGGGVHEWVWNNPPVDRVWALNVVPSCQSDTFGSTAFAQADLTWHLEQERTGYQGSGQEKVPVFKRRLKYKVTNTAGQAIDYSVYVSMVAP
jgi:hypothetical protein